MLIRFLRVVSPIIIVVASAANALTAPPVDFQRDIQPIFAEHCTLCHGMDATDRKSGLRLDMRESALKGGDSGEAAIVPGKPDESELIRRITSTDPNEVMPPPRHNKPLSPKQIAGLTQWIKDGAKYESHWAFGAPRKVPLPEANQLHPVDSFVISRLRERNLALSPQAASSALCR